MCKALCEKYGVEILEDNIIITQNVIEMLMDDNHKVLKFIQKPSWSAKDLTECKRKNEPRSIH